MLENSIKIEKNEVTIFFDTRLYPPFAILKASENFTENFWLVVDGNNQDKMFVKIRSKDKKNEDMKLVSLEFYNFVISMIRG